MLPCALQPWVWWARDPGSAQLLTLTFIRCPPAAQVTPDMYLNTEEFMDAVAATFQAVRGAQA